MDKRVYQEMSLAEKKQQERQMKARRSAEWAKRAEELEEKLREQQKIRTQIIEEKPEEAVKKEPEDQRKEQSDQRQKQGIKGKAKVAMKSGKKVGEKKSEDEEEEVIPEEMRGLLAEVNAEMAVNRGYLQAFSDILEQVCEQTKSNIRHITSERNMIEEKAMRAKAKLRQMQNYLSNN